MRRDGRGSARRLKPLRMAMLGLMFLQPLPVLAGPVSGFGIYLGPIGATEDSFETVGVGFGADAQFVINDSWSLNPFLMSSAERDTDSTITGTTADILVGLQLRYWSGNWFAGPQAFFHDKIIIDSGISESLYGPGLGVLAGYEAVSGWGVESQLDAGMAETEIRYALRLNLTYRWRRGPI